MVSLEDMRLVVGDVLQVGSRIDYMDADTPLLGAVPEFDSMAVVSILTMIEDNYGITIEDDEVSAEVFTTLGSLHEFVSSKLI